MLALGVFMVIVTAGIDLSVGSIMMLSLMILAVVAKAGAALVHCSAYTIDCRFFMWVI